MLAEKVKYYLARFIDLFIGHDFPEWGTVSTEGFVTVTDQNMRRCNRCDYRQTRSWDEEELRLVKVNQDKIKKTLMESNEIGELYGVRFISTNENTK